MLPQLLRAALFLLALAVRIAAQNGATNWTVVPFNSPPSLPLAVRNPYLNTWVVQGNNPSTLSNSWPQLWDSRSVVGWYASIIVDNQTYRLSGQAIVPANITAANQTYVEMTATRTIFMYSAGPMQVNATFLSPITPTDFVSQSLPFSYLYISATSTDGKPHNVRVYSDVSGEPLHSDLNQQVTWASDSNDRYVILRMLLANQIPFAESVNHALDATLFYSSKISSAYTTHYAVHADVTNRGLAGNLSTSLDNKMDTPPRSIGPTNWPVLGISMDYGSIQSTPEPAVWAIGIYRNPTVKYIKTDGSIENRVPYFMSAFDTVDNALRSFLDNFDNNLNAAQQLDATVASAGSQYSTQYADLLALSARQVFGSLDITLSMDAKGQFNTTDVKIFMKNMGGAGSDQETNPPPNTVSSVNTVDTLYSAFPAFLYFNPELAGYLLAPLLEYQDSSRYTLPYAAKNLGSAYPNATGDKLSDGHNYGVEETANMLIMTLAYSQASGNGTYIKQHYNLLTKWANYLMNFTQAPTNQKSADFIPSSLLSNTNQTNLALKGIIGLFAQGMMAQAMGDNNQQFNNTAKQYLQTWQSLSLPSDNSHINMIYGQQNISGLIYNLYADQLLHLNTVPKSVYQALVQYYTTSSSQKFGLPLDSSDPGNGKTNALMLAASSISDVNVRNLLISQVHNIASANVNGLPFGSMYNPTTSSSSDGNSPVQGSIFALLALANAAKSIDIPKGSNSSSGRGAAGAIAGGVVGGIAALAGISIGIFYCRRRKQGSDVVGTYDGDVIDGDPNWTKSRNIHAGATHGMNQNTYNLNYDQATRNAYSSSDGTTQHASMGQTMSAKDIYTHQNPSTGFISQPGGYMSVPQHRSAGDLHPDVEDGAMSSSASLSQFASTSAVTSSGSGGGAQDRPLDGTSPQQVLLAKQTLVNEELRNEVDNLRRDLEQIREERVFASPTDEAPPSYDILSRT